jgi:hypothetical protein
MNWNISLQNETTTQKIGQVPCSFRDEKVGVISYNHKLKLYSIFNANRFLK